MAPMAQYELPSATQTTEAGGGYQGRGQCRCNNPGPRGGRGTRFL